MMAAPITNKGCWISWVCEISSSSHLFEDFFLGTERIFFFFPCGFLVTHHPIDELMMMMMLRASPAMFSMFLTSKF